MIVPSAVLITMVSASTAKLTGTTSGPESVPNAIRPTPPGAISRRHSVGVSSLMTRRSAGRRWPGGTFAPAPSSAAGVVRRAAASCLSAAGVGRAGYLSRYSRYRRLSPARAATCATLKLQFRTSLRDPLAQVTRVRRRRPPLGLVLLRIWRDMWLTVIGSRLRSRSGTGHRFTSSAVSLSCGAVALISPTLTRTKPGRRVASARYGRDVRPSPRPPARAIVPRRQDLWHWPDRAAGTKLDLPQANSWVVIPHDRDHGGRAGRSSVPARPVP